MNLKNISKDDFQHNFIENLRAKSCTYSPKTKVLFVATNKGLFSIDEQNKIIKIENRKQDVFAKKIAFANNNLWGITNDGKLFCKTEGDFIFYNRKEIFQNIKVHQNQIYLSSRNTIFKLQNKKIYKLNSIGSIYNIVDFEVVGNYLFLATSKKLIQIPLENHIQFKELPKIDIHSITFNGKNFPKTSLSRIPFNCNSVVINHQTFGKLV
jgi:ligand-binding sensor domain-containing protein